MGGVTLCVMYESCHFMCDVMGGVTLYVMSGNEWCHFISDVMSGVTRERRVG